MSSSASASPASTPASHRLAPPVLLLLLPTLLAALPAVWMGIHADDWIMVTPRPWAQVAAAFFGDWTSGARGEGGFYRPLTVLSFQLQSFPPFLPTRFLHLGNVALLLGTAWLVYTIGLMLNGGRRVYTALVVLAAVGLNPLRAEATYWLAARSDLLVACGVLGALALGLSALRDDRPWRAAGALVVGALGLMAKESAIAVAAILPLAALLVGDCRRPAARVLLVGGPLLGLGYLLFRGVVLGGLGGYEAGADGRPLWPLAANMATALAALFSPWRAAPGVAAFTVGHAVPGAVVMAALVAWFGPGRGVVMALAAMLAALLPVCFVGPAPMDGTRVLVLPMALLAVAIAALPRPDAPLWRLAAGVPAVLAAMLLGALLSVGPNWSTAREFLAARDPNQRLIAAAADRLRHHARLGVVDAIVVPEPPRTHPRRILDPGLTMVIAMQALWALDGGIVQIVDAREESLFHFNLAGLDGGIRIAQLLQPGLGERVAVWSIADGVLHEVELQRTALDAAQGDEAAALLAMELAPGEAAAWALQAEPPPGAFPATLSIDGAPRLSLPYATHGATGHCWLASGVVESGGAARVEPFPPGAPFRLRAVWRARYTSQPIPASGGTP